MQKQSLIPTPLCSASTARRPVEIVEPRAQLRFRSLRVVLYVFMALLRGVAMRLWPPLRKTYGGPQQQASRLRAFMEQNGGLWIKAGQILALRRDLFSDEFCDELGRLQDRATGFPGAEALRIVEAELGRPISEVFSEFDEYPIAAASIAQVHRARLRANGIEVVVKIRRPYIEESFHRDLRILRFIARFLTRFGFAPRGRWQDMYWEIDWAVKEELDYQQEAASICRMRKKLRRHGVYVPKAYLSLCRDRLLVMELVRGVFMSEYIQVAAAEPARAAAWRRENGINARRVGEGLLLSMYRQRFEDNLYHCDLHPGNILLLRNSRIAFIDFGSVGSTDRTQLQRMLHMIRAIVTSDYHKIADLFLLLAPSLPNRDLTNLKEGIIRVFREFETRSQIKSLPYHQKSSGYAISQTARLMSQEGIPMAWHTLRALRAELTLGASLMFLIPRVEFPKLLRRYMLELRARQREKARSARQVRTRLAQLSDSLDIPGKLAENAYFQGEYLRKRALQYEGQLSRGAQTSGYVFLVLSRACLLGVLIAVVGFLHQRLGGFHRGPIMLMNGLLQHLPRLDWLALICAILALLYLSRELAAVSNILQQRMQARGGDERN